MGLMPMKLLEFCQEVIILKCKNFLTHPFVPLCNVLLLCGNSFAKLKSWSPC